jgi:hypothetical protein
LSFLRRRREGQRLYPRRLGRGGVEEVGSARIVFGEDGVVESCDPHGCSRVRVPSGVDEVLLEPVAPFNRPMRLTGCIYVEFEEPLVYPGGGQRRFWILAPYEVAVVAGGTVVAYVSPIRAKFTLVGDVVGGSVCRYHRSRVAEEPEQLERGPGLAYVAVDVSGEASLVPGIGFYGVGLSLFTDSEARLYYPRLDAVARASFIEVKASQEPPIGGLSLAQRGRRLTLLMPVFSVPVQR